MKVDQDMNDLVKDFEKFDIKDSKEIPKTEENEKGVKFEENAAVTGGEKKENLWSQDRNNVYGLRRVSEQFMTTVRRDDRMSKIQKKREEMGKKMHKRATEFKKLMVINEDGSIEQVVDRNQVTSESCKFPIKLRQPVQGHDHQTRQRHLTG